MGSRNFPAESLTSTPCSLTLTPTHPQDVGMLDKSKHLPAVADMLATAERVLGYDLLQRCTEGGWRWWQAGAGTCSGGWAKLQ